MRRQRHAVWNRAASAGRRSDSGYIEGNSGIEEREGSGAGKEEETGKEKRRRTAEERKAGNCERGGNRWTERTKRCRRAERTGR